MDSIKFSQMLCSRLCHDLITPISAINTSFDLLSTADPEDQKELLKLAEQSAKRAVQKLIFFRAALGYSIDSHFSTFQHTKDLIKSFLALNKIELIWDIESNSSSIPEASIYGQVIANLTFICSEVAPSGGKLKIDFMRDTAQTIHINLEGKLALLRPSILVALQGQLSEDDTSSQLIHALYTFQLCEKLQGDLQIDQKERETLDFIFKITP